jgi:hypothetical protein
MTDLAKAKQISLSEAPGVPETNVQAFLETLGLRTFEPSVKATIDLDFSANEYTVWQDDANSFTKLPLADAITITNGGGTLVRPTGIIGSVGANTGRLTTIAGRQGLLVEGAATNLSWPSNLSTGSSDEGTWQKNGTAETETGFTGPDGSSDAFKVIGAGNNTNSTSGNNLRFFNVPGSDSVNITTSFWIKTAPGESAATVRVRVVGAASGDLAIGVTTDGWVRVDRTALTTTLGTVIIYSESGVPFLCFGLDVKIGSLSSYIPTTTSAVTRVADVPRINPLGSEFRADRGTLIWEGYAVKSPTTDVLVAVSNGSFDERLYLGVNSSGQLILNRRSESNGISNASSTILGSGEFSSGEFLRVVLRWQVGIGVRGFAKGITQAGLALSAAPILNQLRIGHQINSGTPTSYSNTSHTRIRYIPEFLSDSQCLALSKGAN